MLSKLLGLPRRLAKKVLGREAPAAPPPTPPAPPPPAPRRAQPAPRAEPAHDHGHDHDHGGGHDHGHDHDHGAARAAAPVAAVQVEVSDTPNPNARKFTCSVAVVEKGSLSFTNAEEAGGHPLGRAIWGVDGVRTVFAVKDFVTVTKTDAGDWGRMTPKIVEAIRAGMAR